jgi:hypothetical protein
VEAHSRPNLKETADLSIRQEGNKTIILGKPIIFDSNRIPNGRIEHDLNEK